MSQFQLEGNVDTRDQEILALRNQLARLDEALRMERIKTGSVEAGARELRRILTPLFSALKQIYGEMDDMQIADSPAATNNNSKWEAIKSRNPGRIAEAIDVLLIHGGMTSSQLAASLKMNRSNCSGNLIPKLHSLGLAVRNGSVISLKQL